MKQALIQQVLILLDSKGKLIQQMVLQEMSGNVWCCRSVSLHCLLDYP